MILTMAALAAALQADPAAVAEPSADDLNRQLAYLYALAPSEGWQRTASGLRYRVVKKGAGGPSPAPTDTVTLHYAGRLIDGTEFDSSYKRGEPATFPLPRLIKGWQEGMPLMQVGDTYEFAIPYSLAYGPKGKGPIPPAATLLFTIELIDVPGQS